MRRRALAALLALCLTLTLGPAALAAEGDGLTPQTPVQVPDDGLVIQNSTYYGIKASWFQEQFGDAGNYYVTITLPESVVTVADNGFRDNYTGDKRKYGALNTTDNPGWGYDVVEIDFSQATDLTTIGSQAAMYCSTISGVLDLSQTKVETLKKSAFSGCTGLTGVILPDTLKVLGDADGKTGSVFNGCTGLQFVRTADSGPDTVFELPDGLKVIGKQTFKSTFSKGTDLKIRIPASVEIVGSEAFYSNSCFSQIYIERESGFDGYDSGAFKANSTTDCLLIFPDHAAYEGSGNFTRITKTYPVILKFGAELEQRKLYGQSIQYEYDEAAGIWAIDPDYELPQVPEIGQIPGYDTGWRINGDTKILTSTSKVSGWADAALEVYVDNSVVSEPTVNFSVNGEVKAYGVEGNPTLTIELADGKEATAGISIEHPLLKKSEDQTTYVYFKYVWWDIQNSLLGERSTSGEEAEIFSYSPTNNYENRVLTNYAEIPIRNAGDERTGSGNGYVVEIFGYYVKDGVEPSTYFYKSSGGVLAGNDPTRPTTGRVYQFGADVKEAPSYTISASPAALDFGSAQVGYALPEAQTVTITNNGNQEVTITLPTLAGYTITAGEGWTDGKVTLQPDGTANFIVQPEVGLPVGNHSGTLTISGTNSAVTTVDLNFTVTAVSDPTPDPTPGGGNDDHDSDPYLKFNSNGGTEFDPIDGKGRDFSLNVYDDDEYGSHIPTRPGYRFTGWYRDRKLTMRVDEDETLRVRGAITLFAGWAETTVPDLLNGDDHYAYLQGYTDGTIRPNASITRAQVATIFFRLLDEDIRDDYLTAGNPFPDVSEDYWASTAISTMAALGIVNGRSDGSFDPDASITRAEFAAICARFDEGCVSGASAFTDTSGHWAEAEIGRAAALGWIQGYSDGSFRPDQYITRAQAVTMINRMLCRQPETAQDLLPGMSTWTDCREGDWYYLAVQEAANSHGFVAKDRTYETWTSLDRAPDWSRYE